MVYGDRLNLFGKDFLPVEGNRLVLPNGAPIYWPELQWDTEWQAFKFLHKQNRWKKIWGGFLVQNVVSALASVLVREAMLRIHKAGHRIVLQEHDAIAVLVVDDGNSAATLKYLIEEMRAPPSWAPDLPLDAEGTMGETYS
jgi:DNA polymerase